MTHEIELKRLRTRLAVLRRRQMERSIGYVEATELEIIQRILVQYAAGYRPVALDREGVAA